ncbi:MAG: hypothetical protein QM809_04975 [Gordonia sp. (in: high G+C Gram-positive bacteria)]|uniref:hypothetical protein n=1 Tax=Gordonia sp. (in: high G+C Gram-positive bacteria) TaxID=84139 RepID=UPI0039E42726
MSTAPVTAEVLDAAVESWKAALADIPSFLYRTTYSVTVRWHGSDGRWQSIPEAVQTVLRRHPEGTAPHYDVHDFVKTENGFRCRCSTVVVHDGRPTRIRLLQHVTVTPDGRFSRIREHLDSEAAHAA